MKTKRMLAIQGSPRQNGNASKMLDIAIEKAEALGYKVTRIDLSQKNISYCQGCMCCRETGICVIKDDLEEVAEGFFESELILISCPTYLANVPGQVKTLLDRLTGILMKIKREKKVETGNPHKQKYILMTTCSAPFPFDKILGQSSGCLQAMKKTMSLSGIKYGGNVVFAGTKGKSEIPSRIKNRIEKLI